MSNSKYPFGIDTDAELPRVEDNISEIGGEAINSLRAAVFAIEKALGVKPHGTATDLVTRLGASLDNNGNIKASALAAVGLVTLPITNAQVGSAAGIEESKLDLDYGTALLKSWIDSLRVRVDVLEVAVAADIAHLAQHVANPSSWGRHKTSDIDAYGVFTGMNAQGALTNLDTRLNAHVSDPVDAHTGSAISLDASRFTTITATDVQAAAEQLEDLQLVEIVRHRDRQHGNGILGTQDAFVSGTTHGVEIIPFSTTTVGSVGNTFIKFATAPNAQAFQSIVRNDRIDLRIDGQTYTFVIDSTQSTNQVNIIGCLPVSGAGQAAVYKTSEEMVAPSVAMVCMRRDAIGSQTYDSSERPSTLQIVHPNCPYVISSGFRGNCLTASARNLRLLYLQGDTGNLDIYSKMMSLYTSPSTWTAENVAKVLNASLLSPGLSGTRHPIVAFAYKGELGFAYDLPDADGYISIGVPTADDATTTLGFVSGTIGYARAPRELYIDGYEIPSIRLLFDAWGQIGSGDTITFPVANPLANGVKAGHLARISVLARGTYVINNVSANTIMFDSVHEYDFSMFNGQWVRVRVYADAFSLASSPTEHTLYETFLDGYDDGYGPVANFRAVVRASYINTPSGGAGLENIFDVTAVSRTLGSASLRMYYDATAKTVTLGSRAPGPSIVNPGKSVTLPSSNETGFRFTLYDASGVDYFEFEIANYLPGSSGYLDITSYPRISEERFLQLATVLHDGVRFKYINDTRQFGNVGRQDVRDDFIRDYISYPRSLLRGNGVIYGFVTSSDANTLTVTGGQVLVDGQLKSISKTTLTIPADGAATYNLFVDRMGVLRLLRDNFFVAGVLSTPSLEELLTSRTETALAQITVNGFNVVDTIIDVRRFVNDIDNKLDLIVEANNATHGSFASLSAAVAYLNALPTAPVSRRIRVKGNISLNTTVTLPPNTVLEGDSHGHSASPLPPTITFGSGAAIWPSTGCLIRNLLFYSDVPLTNGFLRSYTSFSRVKVDNCRFEFASSAANNNAILLDSSVTSSWITNCWFKNTDTAILCSGSAEYCHISGNFFDEFRTCAIRLDSAINCLIAENHIVTSSVSMTTDDACIQLGASSGIIYWTVVSKNIMIYTGSQPITLYRSMITVQNVIRVLGLSINENTLMSFPLFGVGFSGAMKIAPNLGTEVSVTNNWIYNFTGGQDTCVIQNCNGSILFGNYFINCARTLFTTFCNYVTIVNNVIKNGVGGSMDAHLSLDDSANFIIGGNTISANGAGWLVMLGSSSNNGVICNNFFEYTGSAAGLLLDCRATYTIISGNTLVATTLTLYEALRGGDYNLIIGNNLRITTPASSNLITTGTGCIETLNKGQTYSVWMSPNRAMFGSEWTMELSSGLFERLTATTTTVNNSIAFSFSALDIPADAILSKVTIWYANAGALGDITFQLFTTDIASSMFAAISSIVDAVSTGGMVVSIDVTPTSTHYIPKDGSAFDSLVVLGKIGTSALKRIYGIRLTYQL